MKIFGYSKLRNTKEVLRNGVELKLMEINKINDDMESIDDKAREKEADKR